MAIGNVEPNHEFSPKHSRKITAIMKQDKEPGKEGKKRGVSIEGSNVGKEKKWA